MTVELNALTPPYKDRQTVWEILFPLFLLSLTFLTSALAKTRSFSELESSLAASRLVPIPWVSIAGVFLLVLEYLLSVLLFIPATRRPALYTAAIVISTFVAYTVWRWMQGIGVPCHCFGVLFKLAPWQSLLLNGILLGMTAHLLTIPTPSLSSKTTVSLR